jgi:predicted nucleotidyltransferase
MYADRARLRRLGPERTRPPLTLAAIQEAVEAVFRDDPRVDAVALFGSYVRNRVRGRSDVDLAVLLTPPAEKQKQFQTLRSAWQQELSRRFGGYPVDVIVLPHAPLLLRRNIGREGRLLLEQQPGAWRRFRHRVLNEWRDRARVRERFWQRFLQRWEEVGFGERYRDHTATLDEMRSLSLSLAGDADRE